MGSPKEEAWRSADETRHPVTVSDFYMAPYELTQAEYEAVTGENPSNFTGPDLPVENVTWLQAVAFCNAYSEEKGLTPAYTIEGQQVRWDRSANGYRLPTEAEWEYACRGGTSTPLLYGKFTQRRRGELLRPLPLSDRGALLFTG